MSKSVQNAGAVLTYLHDWSKRLARAESDLGLEPGTLKLSAPSVSGPAGVTATEPQVNVAGTGVTFKLTTSSPIVPPVDVVVTTRATLSNGDTDEVDTDPIGII